MVSIEYKCELNNEGTISDSAACIIQPERIIQVELHMYQLQTIYQMLQLENQRKRVDSNTDFFSEMGVLSNKVGSGKSLCVLGLIAHTLRLECKAKVEHVYEHIGHVVHDGKSKPTSANNLLVVPNHIVKPIWENYMSNYTTFRWITVKKGMFPIDWESICEYDVVLCSASQYNLFMKSCSIYWSRVIFDEADSINIAACTPPKCQFVWFVSSSLNNLLFCNGYYWKIENSCITRMVTTGILRNGYIKNTFKQLETVKERHILKSVIIKLNDSYIDSFIPLLPIKHNNIICQTPYYLKVLHDVLPDNMVDILHGNDLQYALQVLGFPVDSNENIISFVSRNIRMKQNNLEKKMEYLRQLEFESLEDQTSNTNNINQTFHEMEKLKTQLQRIHEVVSGIDEEELHRECPICYVRAEEGRFIIFSCCLNVFCESCVQSLLLYQLNHCPLCRSALSRQTILKPVQTTNTMYKENILRTLLDYDKNDKKIVVFFKRDASVGQLLATLRNPYKVLHGNNQTILKTLEWFQQETNNILFVNVELYGCGLNLLQTTDIVFFQRMSRELENQLIGRAYRIGRQKDRILTVHHLIHQEEFFQE